MEGESGGCRWRRYWNQAVVGGGGVRIESSGGMRVSDDVRNRAEGKWRSSDGEQRSGIWLCENPRRV